MSDYEDMRDFQRREEDPDYIVPSRAYTQEDLAEFEHDHGPDYREILDEVMERDMARYNREVAERKARRDEYITRLEELLDENGIDY